MEKFGPTEDFSPFPSPPPGDAQRSQIPPGELAVGQLVDNRYRIEALLGKGGFGCVYKVTRLFDRCDFALKLLSAKNMSEVVIRRFRAEARAAHRLDHPNLVRAIDYGVFDAGQPYLVMEYVHGPTLSAYLKQKTTLSVSQVITLFKPIALGLAYAHDQGVIHRDIKPSNLILATDGSSFQPKIVDFGIAKIQFSDESHMQTLTKTGDIFGTPLYMSPEQCMGTVADARSDIYSLGCVMFEALTGAPPFRGNNPLETMMQHSQGYLPSLKQASLGQDFPQALELIIAKMLAKDPADRYQNCYMLANDLNAFQTGDQEKIKAAPIKAQSRPSGTRDNSIVMMLSIASMLLGIISVYFYTQLRQHIDKQDMARSAGTSVDSPTPMVEDEQYFSRVTKAGREFHFDHAHSIGTLTWGKGPKNRAEAKGIVVVPRNAKVVFRASEYVASQPYILAHFRRDDLFGVELSGNEALSAIGDVDTMLRMVSCQDNLQILVLRWFDVDRSTLALIGNMKQVRWLHLQGMRIHSQPITGADIANFANLPKLRYLGISTAKSITPLMKQLQKCSNLERLFLEYVEGLSSEDTKLIAKIPSLRVCSIFIAAHRCEAVAVIDELSKAPKLAELRLYKGFYTRSRLDNLAKSKSLKLITFIGEEGKIPDAGKIKIKVVPFNGAEPTSTVESLTDAIGFLN